MDLTNIPKPANRKSVISETVFHITEEDGAPITPRVVDNQDGTYRIEYTPPEHTTALGISVLVAGSQIAQSPYVVPVSPAFDTSKLKIIGLDKSKYDKCIINQVDFAKLYIITNLSSPLYVQKLKLTCFNSSESK